MDTRWYGFSKGVLRDEELGRLRLSDADNRTDIDIEQQLVNYLFKDSNYDKSVRPGVYKNGIKQPVRVSTSFMVYRILELVRRCRILLLRTQPHILF